MRFSGPFLFGGALFFASRGAFAGGLSYEAPAGCPAAETVADRASKRAPDSRDAQVVIRPHAQGYAAQVTVGDGDDAIEREVVGRTCDGVVEAALVVMSLDHAPAPEPAPVVAAPASVPVAEPPAEAPLAAPPNAPSPVAIGVGMDGVLRGLGGTVAAGGAVFGELGAPGLFGWRRYRPSVRLDGTFVTSASGKSRFGGASLELCPLGLAAIDASRTELAIAACGVFDAGSARYVTSGGYFDVGGVARARLTMGPRDRTRWFVDLALGVVRRIGDDDGLLTQLSQASPNASLVVIAVPSLTMPLAMLGGGVVFP